MEALFVWQNCEIEIRFCFMVGTHKTMEKEWVRWIWESCLSNISDIQTSIIIPSRPLYGCPVSKSQLVEELLVVIAGLVVVVDERNNFLTV